jgi:hypothetical protein|tara:strand:- start:1067 stop:1528 length:462 start_codon:yes stop_codon:yes gene_type:complete
MKNIISSIFTGLFLLFTLSIYAQDEKTIVIEDFIEQHETLISYRGNDGEIDWESKNEINKKIRFFIEEKYPNVISTRNIMWDSYETYLSPYDRHHYHTFIAGVKVENISRMKYVNVNYYPDTQKINSSFQWDNELKDFVEINSEETSEEEAEE